MQTAALLPSDGFMSRPPLECAPALGEGSALLVYSLKRTLTNLTRVSSQWIPNPLDTQGDPSQLDNNVLGIHPNQRCDKQQLAY